MIEITTQHHLAQHGAVVNRGQSFFSQRLIAKITLSPINALRSTYRQPSFVLRRSHTSILKGDRHFPKTCYATGIAYLGLIIMIAIIGIAAVATVQLGAIVQRREAEEELLFIGSEFRNALISYASATPAGQQSAPQTLQDLLKDPRYPNLRRHLRKIYLDPITGKDDWQAIQSIDGKGIIGVHSASTNQPIKIGNFAPELQHFTGKTSYADWVFMVNLPNVTTPNNRSN